MRLTRRQSLAALGLLSLGRPAQASMTEPDLASERIRRGAPALGVAWQGKGETAQIRVTGVRAARGDDPVLADSRWHLGSLTKSMTATLAARAVEMGRIDWNSRIDAIVQNAERWDIGLVVGNPMWVQIVFLPGFNSPLVADTGGEKGGLASLYFSKKLLYIY